MALAALAALAAKAAKADFYTVQLHCVKASYGIDNSLFLHGAILMGI